MKRRLYPNIKHLTTLFCISIICVTLTTLMLRLTVFSDMAVYATAQQEFIQSPETEDASYRIASSVRFSNAGARGKIGIENLSEEYYMTVSVILPDTMDSIIYTGFIEQGKKLDEVSLDIPLEEGEYQCTAEIAVYDPANPLYPLGKEERTITVQVG